MEKYLYEVGIIDQDGRNIPLGPRIHIEEISDTVSNYCNKFGRTPESVYVYRYRTKPTNKIKIVSNLIKILSDLL